MFKKVLSLILAVAMLSALALAFTSCNGGEAKSDMTEAPLTEVILTKDFDIPSDFKLGVICLHDEASTYDLNFINGVEKIKTVLGLTNDQVIYKKNIPESAACTEAAEDLVDQGCDIVFANSFGHESFLLEAAKNHPEVQFCHATGTMAHTESTSNFHNAFASIYEGRYLAGVAAGLKLNEMIAAGEFTAEEAKIGYVGAYTYAEVISGYTSFYLGAKSVCPTVTMDVQFTGSWFDLVEENNAAKALLARDCKLISQHADSMGAPSACEEAGVPNISYNGSTVAVCPNTFIISSAINWAPYYEYIIDCVKNGKDIDTNWCGGIEQGSVVLSEINEAAAAAGTADAIATVKAKLLDGSVKVFDCSTFTVNGQALTEADNTNVKTENGVTYFAESVAQSAPMFEYRIDGITLVNEKY